MSEKTHPWERHKDESSKAWYAFQLFRDMGVKRSLSQVAEVLSAEGQKTGSLKTWSSKHKWEERTRQFDAYMNVSGLFLQQKSNQQEYLEKLHNYRKQSESVSQAMISIGVKTMQLLQHELNERLKEPKNLKGTEIASLMRASVDSIDVGNQLYVDVLAVDEMLELLRKNNTFSEN